MLNREDIIKIIKKEKLPSDKYWVGAGSALTLHGIREFTNDIDIGCNTELFNFLIKSRNLKPSMAPMGGRMISINKYIDIFEEFKTYNIEYIEGIPCESLEDILAFKKLRNRSKDQNDIKLIKKRLKEKNKIKLYNKTLFLNESYTSNIKLYHLSESNLNGKILIPRIPDNRMTRDGREENKTPRISFSTSIDGALMGITGDLTGKEYFVHVVDFEYSEPEIKEISNKEVPDQFITGEIWVLNKVKLKYLKKIKVTKTYTKTFKQGRGSMKNNAYEWKNIYI